MSHKIAPNSLDFSVQWSATVPVQRWRNDVDSAIINEAIIACLTEIHARLSEAARIAKAAEACASAGSVAEA
jgi:hypothetical protein